MFTNVAFNPDGKAKPDHTMSILMNGCCINLALALVILQEVHGTAKKTPLLRTNQMSGSHDASVLGVVQPSS